RSLRNPGRAAFLRAARRGRAARFPPGSDRCDTRRIGTDRCTATENRGGGYAESDRCSFRTSETDYCARRDSSASARSTAPSRSGAGRRPPLTLSRPDDLVVAGNQAKRPREVVDELGLAHEDRARPVDDRVVDRAERDLHGETDVHFLLVRELPAGVALDLPDAQGRELVPLLANGLPELRVVDAAHQRRAPEAPPTPKVADRLRDHVAHPVRAVGLCEHTLAQAPPVAQMMRDQRVEILVLALEARVKRADRVTCGLR